MKSEIILKNAFSGLMYIRILNSLLGDMVTQLSQKGKPFLKRLQEFNLYISMKLSMCYLYCAPVEFAVQPDCRPPAMHFPGGITVNPGGLQCMCVKITSLCMQLNSFKLAFPFCTYFIQMFKTSSAT
jgi:hypothetical protein